ncbi:MAG: DUF4913 domain-containing protein [Actinomycetaceae bacterium]|nr:DUF4913 domain-containing protein [Actinomycetaceae bacterium]
MSEKLSIDPEQLVYASVVEFTEQYLAAVYDRPTHPQRRAWCAQWWAHGELFARFTALWTAWESLRLHGGPEGMAKWFVSYADPIMAVVFDPNGPLALCTAEEHRESKHAPDYRLPTLPVSPELNSDTPRI